MRGTWLKLIGIWRLGMRLRMVLYFEINYLQIIYLIELNWVSFDLGYYDLCCWLLLLGIALWWWWVVLLSYETDLVVVFDDLVHLWLSVIPHLKLQLLHIEGLESSVHFGCCYFAFGLSTVSQSWPHNLVAQCQLLRITTQRLSSILCRVGKWDREEHWIQSGHYFFHLVNHQVNWSFLDCCHLS